jgi:hypothetical protein
MCQAPNNDRRGRACREEEREGRSSARGNGTHDVGVINALEDPHLVPHALLVPLSFLLRNGLQRDLAREVHSWRHRRCLAREESEVADEDLGEGRGWG